MSTVLVSDPEPAPSLPTGVAKPHPMLTIVTRKTPAVASPPKDSESQATGK